MSCLLLFWSFIGCVWIVISEYILRKYTGARDRVNFGFSNVRKEIHWTPRSLNIYIHFNFSLIYFSNTKTKSFCPLEDLTYICCPLWTVKSYKKVSFKRLFPSPLAIIFKHFRKSQIYPVTCSYGKMLQNVVPFTIYIKAHSAMNNNT